MRKTEQKREPARSEWQQDGEKADLYCTAGTSPPDRGTHRRSLQAVGVRIVSITCVPTSDCQDRLRRIAFLLLGAKADEGNGSKKSKGGLQNAA